MKHLIYRLWIDSEILCQWKSGHEAVIGLQEYIESHSDISDLNLGIFTTSEKYGAKLVNLIQGEDIILFVEDMQSGLE